MTTRPLAVIVGVGDGVSASIARLLAHEGYGLVLASRSPANRQALAQETGAVLKACDAASHADVEALFAALSEPPDVVVYNPSYRVRGPLLDLDPAAVWRTLEITAFGGFLVGQAAARVMLPAGRGTILFTGASASVKGFAQSAPFAMGKFALRGLAQSMARELHPKGIHVAHVVIDGAIRSERYADPENSGRFLDPDAIAASYLHLIRQPRSVWTDEIAVRPWVETF